MMISHRFELNKQAIKSFEWICNEDVDLEQGMFTADRGRCRIVVASVQSLNSKRRGKYRMERFDPDEFGLLLIDEAHRSAAASYRKVVEHFSQNPNLVTVGVTATPDRLDKIGLGVVFDEVVCDYNIQWGIDQGYLVPPKQIPITIEGLDLSQIRTVGGDLDSRQLAKMVEVEQTLHEMAKPIVDLAGESKKTIVFTASVAQARRLAEMIRDYHEREFGKTTDQRAVSLDGSLSPQDPRRQQIVEEFKRPNSEIQFLVNCGVATEGFDAPNVELIAIGRPTKSRALYVQMLGRGTRPLPSTIDGLDEATDRIAAIKNSSKPHCVILDFIGQSGRHKLVTTQDILAGESTPEEVSQRASEIIRDKDFSGDSLDALNAAREDILRQRELSRAKITVDVKYKLHDSGTPYDLESIQLRKAPNYLKNREPTEKQKSMLIRLGFTQAQINEMNPRSASSAIDYAIENPKTSFGRWMRNKKYETK